jgi:DnaJ-class molecular chaperone
MGWPYTKACPRCKGTCQVKHWWSGRPRPCPRCQGDGVVQTVTYLIYSRWRYGRDSW